MEYTNNRLISLTGILFIIISASIFYFPNELWVAHNSMGIFTSHYLISMLFAGIVFIHAIRYKKYFHKASKSHILLLLTLFTISAFALNRDFSVFDESVLWLSMLIILQCITFTIHPFLTRLPRIFSYITYFIWGLNLLLYLYFTIYLLPLTLPGVIGLIIFGITIHIFIPTISLIVVIHSIVSIRRDRNLLISTGAGLILAIIIIAYSALQWNNVNQFFRNHFHQNLISKKDNMLPDWVHLAQNLPKGYYFTQFLKLDIIYITDMFSFRGFNLHDQKRHDPLINVLSNIMPAKSISYDEKLSILKVNEGLRHQAEDRLWSGKDLKTDHIIKRIEVFPQYRISYTDLIMTIHNLSNYEFNQQEALYTFYLPEGAVATSLSLWIEGEEQQARLTTKHKADSAYTTIVSGRRDPSVVHWQEGNRLIVRVFPCTPREPRVFRIGITSPMKENGDSLDYQPIFFKGPSTAKATEYIEIINKSEQELFVPVKMKSGQILERDFRPGFEFSVKTPALSKNAFTYENHAYLVEHAPVELENMNIKTLYLDLNKEWEIEEVEQLSALGFDLKFTALNKIITLSDLNEEELEPFFNKNFSLIPFHLIEENSVIITKGTDQGPFLSDLKNKEYLSKINALEGKSIFNIFSINGKIPPYLKTLVGTNLINFDEGNMDELLMLLQSGKFKKAFDEKNKMHVPNAGINIIKTEAQFTGSELMAPDHLLRLYNYLALMQDMKVEYLFEKTPPEHLYVQAEKAFAVTPFTSLIVLEQLADYERFDIKKNKDTLGNAALNNSGAIPEPHEWVLIILVSIMVSVILFKRIL